MEISKAEIASAAATSAKNSTSLSSGHAPAGSSDIPELRGAEILIRALQAEGVKYVWGYPGFSSEKFTKVHHGNIKS